MNYIRFWSINMELNEAQKILKDHNFIIESNLTDKELEDLQFKIVDKLEEQGWTCVQDVVNMNGTYAELWPAGEEGEPYSGYWLQVIPNNESKGATIELRFKPFKRKKYVDIITVTDGVNAFLNYYDFCLKYKK